MDPDDLKQAWRTQTSQTRLTIESDLLLKEVQRNAHYFTAMIFWRDFREVGLSLLMVPLWLYLGIKNSSPWTWYLMVPAMLWIAGYLLVDRIRHNRLPPQPGGPLRQCLEDSLAHVEHQIWLLRNVHWWYLLPFAVSMLAFFGQVSWQERAGGWRMVLATSMVVAIGVGILTFVYWLNQYAVRYELEPRHRELETLLRSFADETAAAS